MEDYLQDNIETAMRERAYEIAWIEGNQTLTTTPESLLPEKIKRLLKTAQQILKSKEERPFTMASQPLKGIRMTAFGTAIIDMLKIDVATIRAKFQNHQFHPMIDLIIEVGESAELFDQVWYVQYDVGANAIALVALLNSYVEKVRLAADSKKFKTEVRNFERSSNENFLQFNRYIDAHFTKRSRLLFVRLDLGYKDSYLTGIERDVETVYHRIKQDWAKLHKDLTRKILRTGLCGYVWKLEFGLSKSFHLHVLLILNSSMFRGDVTIAKIVGDHWNNTITTGDGTYFNCNAKKEHFRFCGIGQIGRDDFVGRENLSNRVGMYLTKPDYVVALKAPDGGRTFSKGIFPK